MAVLIILIYIFIGALEITGLYRAKKRKEVIVYSVIFLISLILSIICSRVIRFRSLASIIESIILGTSK